jgi:hypothetical protein
VEGIQLPAALALLLRADLIGTLPKSPIEQWSTLSPKVVPEW